MADARKAIRAKVTAERARADMADLTGLAPREIPLVSFIPFNDFIREISFVHLADYQIFSIFIFNSEGSI